MIPYPRNITQPIKSAIQNFVIRNNNLSPEIHNLPQININRQDSEGPPAYDSLF
jgi:hypothetical protein